MADKDRYDAAVEKLRQKGRLDELKKLVPSRVRADLLEAEARNARKETR